MNSFRNPKYLERREDVVFDLEQPLVTNPANDATQNRSNIRFVADNKEEVTPFDCYNARFSMDFKVNLLANGGDIAAADHNGIVNGSNAFIKKLTILANGREVYSCNNANHCLNIKNLLEYSPSYAESIATNEFYFLDTTRNPDEDRLTTRQVQHGRNDAGNGWEARNFVESFSATYNKGFAARKALLGTSDTVNCEIPINRYSFFESLENKLLPNTRIELNLEIDKDDNLIWQNGANCRIIITRLQFFVPRLIFNAEGQKLYMENYLKPYKWTYLNEVVETSNNTKQQTGLFKITTGISKPRHVFIFIINSDTFTFTLNKEYDGLDWYRSRILMSFKLTKLTGANITVNDNNGIVNGAHSFIKNISFSINDREVYNCTNANHCMNIKNLISYSPNYAETVPTNELFFLDTSTSANSNKYLTRQVQHGRNNDNTGWTPRVFIENEDPSFNSGFAA